jgi:hypothetical protein
MTTPLKLLPEMNFAETTDHGWNKYRDFPLKRQRTVKYQISFIHLNSE